MTSKTQKSLVIDVLLNSLGDLKNEWKMSRDPQYIEQYHACYNHLITLGWNGNLKSLAHQIPAHLRPPKSKGLDELLALEDEISKEVDLLESQYPYLFNKRDYLFLRRHGVDTIGIDIDKLISVYPRPVGDINDDTVNISTLIHTLHNSLFYLRNMWIQTEDPEYIERYQTIHNHLISLGWSGNMDIEEMLVDELMPPHRQKLIELKAQEAEIDKELEAFNRSWPFDPFKYKYLRRIGAKPGSIDTKKIAWNS